MPPSSPSARWALTPQGGAGFSLPELLLAAGLGLSLGWLILQALISEGQLSQRWSRLLRERSYQRRTLDLVRVDLQRALVVSADPQQSQAACSLGGRLPVLHLTTASGPITYSVGAPPSGIWRDQVLMRCGPAYGLDGSLSQGKAQNRVVVDGLAGQATAWRGCALLLGPLGLTPVDLAGSSKLAFSACLDPASGLVALRLQQAVATASNRQWIETELLAKAAG
jgi:hypothetical protein